MNIQNRNFKKNHGTWLRCVALCCSVLQCVAMCCIVLQCVVVCCGVLSKATLKLENFHQLQLLQATKTGRKLT